MRATHSPLPIRDGVAPSYIWLPEAYAGSLIDFLAKQFPAIATEVWLRRIARNEVVDISSNVLNANSMVKRGMCIFYYRELDDEVSIPFQEQLLFQDEHILVVDKPHFLPVTPSGRFLQETLLVRLKKQTGLNDLTPIHRLDRETAGVMLLSHQRATRGLYQALFQQRKVQKIYHAIAPTLTFASLPFIHRSRLVESERFFVMREVEGELNSETQIDCLEQSGDLSLYELRPVTGRKHQLRAHLSSLGAPIMNDNFYPTPLPMGDDDYTKPLQLLAKTITFIDPITHEKRSFSSPRSLCLSDWFAQNS
jgi:tRNA pseudouridine32 synthase / 23S rRNA pseudouridine746 synthase